MRENKENEKFIEDSPVLTIKKAEKIVEQMKNAICQIKTGDDWGTGFFCVINFENGITKKGLFTAQHVFSSLCSKTLKIFLNNKKISCDITVDPSRFLYKDEGHDLVFLEITPEDNIKCSYLELDFNLNNIKEYNNKYHNKLVYIIQYPYRSKCETSFGKLKVMSRKNEFYIWHNCSTDEGSSGSPIILLENLKVIGIHLKRHKTSEKINEGNFLFDITSFIKTNYLEFIKNQDKEKLKEQYFEEEKSSRKNNNLTLINTTEKNTSKLNNFYKKQSSTLDSSISQNLKYNIDFKGKNLFEANNIKQLKPNDTLDFDNNINYYINDNKLEAIKDEHFFTDLSNIENNNFNKYEQIIKGNDSSNIDISSNYSFLLNLKEKKTIEDEIEKNIDYNSSDNEINEIAESLFQYNKKDLSKISYKKDCNLTSLTALINNQTDNSQKNKYKITYYNNKCNYIIYPDQSSKNSKVNKSLQKISILDNIKINPTSVNTRTTSKNNTYNTKENSSNYKNIQSNKGRNPEQCATKNSYNNILNTNLRNNSKNIACDIKKNSSKSKNIYPKQFTNKNSNNNILSNNLRNNSNSNVCATKKNSFNSKKTQSIKGRNAKQFTTKNSSSNIPNINISDKKQQIKSNKDNNY